jgi:tRNA 2-selenouridine synthase
VTWRELSPEQFNDLKNKIVVDARSPCEYVAESIPGAVNVPLLDDAERAEVGTMYKHQGEVAARRLALRIISPKIPEIVDEILALRTAGSTIVVHCWRGGLRSEAVVSFLTVVGIDSWRLTGGYKAWRKVVLQELSGDAFAFDPIILHGQTGVGKTGILTELTARGASALDLEALANHRGSVFGGLGLGNQPTQKNFDAVLWTRLRTLGNRPVYLEAESRKVGSVALPDSILKCIQNGRRILVTGSVNVRAERIWREYAGRFDQDVLEQALAALSKLKERLGGKRVKEISALFHEGNIKDAVEVLLVEYYDPLYEMQIKKYEPYDLIVNGDHPERAAHDLLEWSRQLAPH